MDDKEKKAIKVFQNKKIKDVATKEKDSFFSVRYIPSNSILKQVESISNQKTNSILNSWVRLAADEKTYKRQIENEKRILEISSRILGQINDDKKRNENIRELENETLKKYLLSRLSQKAQEKKGEKNFLDVFRLNSNHKSVVVSIDIRDSTQLMLNAKTPELFAEFISDVSEKISKVIKENYGIPDKFTGDGLLCFFSKGYSGEDAIYYALRASAAAHKLFETEYKKHYDKFSVVKADVGLGIGIDYGDVFFAPICQEPTIVGKPVVYACRLSAAPAYHTYLNQPAFECVEKKYSHLYSFDTHTISFKNQGSMVAYDVDLNFDAISPKEPEWLNDN
ncbi:MAG: adenylate/guanylate cyclase domain-containing protein [Fibrobacter sp.]|nr:adenylate/guanylate cyclase domain-containing protein [Fibrobacter sp.]